MPEGRAALSFFLLAPDLVHLNHGSYGALPKVVAAEQDRLRAHIERDPTSFFQFECPAALRKMAGIAANHFGGNAHDWVFCENATAAVNSVLASLPFGPGDEIATTSHAYGAVLNAMRVWAERKGAHVAVADVPPFVESNEQVVKQVADVLNARTKLLVIDHITSATAIVFPVAQIVEAAKRASIPVLVDGAHAPGQIALDVPALGADWYTGNAHKWLFAPKGCGLLWTAPAQQAVTRPTVLSHGAFDYQRAFDWIGTRDVTPWLCLETAVRAHADFGGAQLAQRNRALAKAAADELADELQARPSAPAGMRAAMAAIALGPALSGEEAFAMRARLLDEFRLVAPISNFGGSLWVRISAQIYNEMADYRRLAAVLRSIMPSG